MSGEKTMPFYIVLFACLLVVLGDLRNVITPVGYWGLWVVVFCLGLLSGSWKKIQFDWVVIGVSFGFIFLILSLLIVGFINSDSYTVYQSSKYLMIYALMLVLFKQSRFLRVEQLYHVAVVVTLAGLFFFLLSKYVLVDYFILLGDGRQGSAFAFPGVLWKTSAFFSPFLIARLLSGSLYKGWWASLVLLSSVYLLLADSSRTGFLWFAVVVLIFALLMFLVNAAQFFSFVSIAVLLVAVTVFINLDSIYDLLGGHSFLVVNRLLEGDPIRERMIGDGIANAETCFPFGCGFGSSTSSVDGVPMVVHNTYIAIFGDLGVLGELALLMIVLTPIVVFSFREWVAGGGRGRGIYYKAAACLGVLCYCFILLFHPLSSEMSEWGYWAIMLSWLSRMSCIESTDEAVWLKSVGQQRFYS